MGRPKSQDISSNRRRLAKLPPRLLLSLIILFAIGFLGIMMRRFGWSRPAFLIGFVLSNPAETYANQALQIAQSRFRKGFGEGLEYIFSPIVIV